MRRVTTVRRLPALALVGCLSLLAVGCHDFAKQDFPLVINDGAGLLSAKTEATLAQQRLPTGFVFEVHTIDRVQPRLVGVRADEIFEELNSESPRKKAFGKRGVLLVVAAEPKLVMARVGSEISMQARRAGLTAGPDYIALQSPAAGASLDATVLAMVKRLADRLPAAVEVAWYERGLVTEVQATILSELEDFSLPSESFYGRYILRPVLGLRVLELNRFGTWWITYVLLGVVLFLIRGLVGFALRRLQRLVVRRTQQREGAGTLVRGSADVLAILLSWAFGLLLAVPAAGSAILLSGSRLEDQLALRSLEVPGLSALEFLPELFAIKTSLGLATLVGALRLLKGFAERSDLLPLALMPDDAQQELYEQFHDRHPAHATLMAITAQRAGKSIELSAEDFDQQPYTAAYFMPGIDDLYRALLWGAIAALFLQAPLSWGAVFFWTVPVSVGAAKSIAALLNRGNRPRR